MSFIPFYLGQKFDDSGAPLAGGLAYFRVQGTTTAATVYEDAGLTDPHPYPIVADASGRFPPIVYLNDAVSYRYDLTDSGGDLTNPVEQSLKVNNAASTATIGTSNIVDGAVTAVKAVATLVTDLLGFTPANQAGDTFTGEVRLNYTPTTINTDAAGFRLAPTNTQDSAYTLVLNDAGKTILHTSGSAHAWSIPPNSSVAFPLGTVILLANVGAGAVTVTRGAGVALRIAGVATDAHVTMAQWGLATLAKVASDSWMISGAGLS